VGQRRSSDEFGEVLRRRIPAEFFDVSGLDSDD